MTGDSVVIVCTPIFHPIFYCQIQKHFVTVIEWLTVIVFATMTDAYDVYGALDRRVLGAGCWQGHNI